MDSEDLRFPLRFPVLKDSIRSKLCDYLWFDFSSLVFDAFLLVPWSFRMVGQCCRSAYDSSWYLDRADRKYKRCTSPGN